MAAPGEASSPGLAGQERGGLILSDGAPDPESRGVRFCVVSVFMALSCPSLPGFCGSSEERSRGSPDALSGGRNLPFQPEELWPEGVQHPLDSCLSVLLALSDGYELRHRTSAAGGTTSLLSD